MKIIKGKMLAIKHQVRLKPYQAIFNQTVTEMTVSFIIVHC